MASGQDMAKVTHTESGVVAAIAAGLLAPPAEAVYINVPCPECDAWPLWLQVVLTLVGVVLGLAVLAAFLLYLHLTGRLVPPTPASPPRRR